MTVVNPALKRIARDMMPPVAFRLLEQRIRGVRYVGNYPDWESARLASRGYDAPEILESVAKAARLVRDGKMAYERDGVAFAEPAFVWPVLACVLGAAARADGQVAVVDFGGSLGSLYFQHRSLFRGLSKVRWTVVEQPAFVELGRREFTNDELRFASSITEAVSAMSPTVVLFSGVLAWVSEPDSFITEALATKVENIVIARTPIVDASLDQIRVQKNSPGLGGGSYPCRMFARGRFIEKFSPDYTLCTEWPESDQVEGRVSFRGLWFRQNIP